MSSSPFDIDATIRHMSTNLDDLLSQMKITDPLMVGIYTGGVWVAERLHKLLKLDSPLGTLDISFYRDDFTRIGVNPQVKPSQIPVPVDDRQLSWLTMFYTLGAPSVQPSMKSLIMAARHQSPWRYSQTGMAVNYLSRQI